MLVMLWSIEHDETWIYVKRCLLLIQKTYDKYFLSSECPAGLVGGVEYYYNHSSSHRNRKVIVEANGRTSEPSNAALRI